MVFPGWANITGQVTLVCSIDFTWFVKQYYISCDLLCVVHR